MNMKKRLLPLMMIFALASCKKETSNAPLYGYWAGTGLIKGTTLSQYFGFLYNNDGTVRAYDAGDTTAANKASGTYVIDSDSIRTVLNDGVTETQFSAVVNDANTQMFGTFRRTTGTYSGSYSVTKR